MAQVILNVPLYGVYSGGVYPCRVNIHGPGYRLPKSGVRKLHIDGVEYLYKIKGHTVQFFLEDKKIVADISTVSGKGWDLIERGQYKKTDDGYVTPGHCKAFLTEFLAGNFSETMRP
jgi:hypothetical protein